MKAQEHQAVKWLASMQLENGSWENNPGHSGLALLCFLERGETPLSIKYGETVKTSIQWLAKDYKKKGNWGNAYSHGIATFAMAEAYSMTQIPFLKPIIKSAVKRIIDGQQEGGGFDYNYKKGQRWDMSVSGWQFQALVATKLTGVEVEGLDKAIVKGRKFCKQVFKAGSFSYCNTTTDKKADEKIAYPNPVNNMTGVGTFSLYRLMGKSNKDIKAGLKTICNTRLKDLRDILKDPRKWDDIAGKNLYGWYFDTRSVYNTAFIRKEWKKWTKIHEPVIIKAQHQKGYWVVSKGPGMGDNQGGKIIATTLCLLQLIKPMHYMPTFDVRKTKDLNNSEDGVVIELE
ncbi:MAG: hypothetical protein HRT89_18190 [Lentisphaeria bacterium]|nr:hypothetical protein [Lentisphaeria bacterium]NQZ69988.1 hypothetical protein [Lentisphaeria bacterium]